MKIEQDNKFVRSLIINAQYGNNSAFQQLYTMNSGRVYALALRLSGDFGTAEILTKNVFFTVWQNLDKIKQDVPFSSWLAGITVYTVLKHIKNKKPDTADYKSKIYNTELDPLDKIILKLPEEERIIYVLFEIEQYTLNKIADLLVKPVTDIKTDLNKARSAIIKELNL